MRTTISSIIESEGPSWLGDRGGVTSHRYVSFEQRRRSTLAIVDVETADDRRRLLVKAVEPSPAIPTNRSVRIVPRSAPGDRLADEYVALERLAAMGDDERFFAVRPVGFYEPSVMVMEWHPDSSLRERLVDRTVGPEWLLEVLQRTGAWLSRFHGLAENEVSVYDSLAEVTSILQRFEALAVSSPLGWPFRTVSQLAVERSRDLEAEVPLGLLHGDMAPRNLLVDDAGRVGGIDVAARWTAPILHDIASFLLSLQVGRHRTLHRDAARIDGFIDAFLSGYGLADRWRGHLEVFCALVLLDRAWAAAGSVRRAPEWLMLASEARRMQRRWRDD